MEKLLKLGNDVIDNPERISNNDYFNDSGIW